MHFVDDDEAEISEQAADFRVTAEHERLQRLRRDLQNARRVLQKLSLVRLRHIAVPVPHRNIRLFAEVIEPGKLIIDERFQRSYVQSSDRRRRILGQKRENRKKCRLRLSRCGRSAEQQIIVGIENGVGCRRLNGAQRLPVIPVYKILNKRCKPCENIHDIISNRRWIKVRPVPQ